MSKHLCAPFLGMTKMIILFYFCIYSSNIYIQNIVQYLKLFRYCIFYIYIKLSLKSVK